MKTNAKVAKKSPTPSPCSNPMNAMLATIIATIRKSTIGSQRNVLNSQFFSRVMPRKSIKPAGMKIGIYAKTRPAVANATNNKVAAVRELMRLGDAVSVARIDNAMLV